MDANRPRPPVLDMTPEGEFRDPPPVPRAGLLDKVLARVGGLALLVALAAGGLLVVALALVFVGLVLPVLIAAGAVAFLALWWRVRRLRRQVGMPPGMPPGAGGGKFRFVVVRR